MEYDIRDAAEMADAVRAFFAADAVVITKKTKRGEGELDIKPAVQSIELAPDAEEKCVRVHAVVSAQEPTLNPELLGEALRQKAPELAPDFAKYTRIETYDAQMNVFR